MNPSNCASENRFWSLFEFAPAALVLNRSFFTVAFGLCLLASLVGCKTDPPVVAPRHPTYVLVHGAFGGGWDWRQVDDLLAADGCKVFRPTLTGQGERLHLATTNIDLDTHIQDIVSVILWENLHDVVLVGHSYGGMVITGVADRVPDRIKHVIYVDAILPVNGESVNTTIPSNAHRLITNGFVVVTRVKGTPPPHEVSMPAKTFSEPITLTNQAAAQKIPATYILTVDEGKAPDQDTFYPFYLRAQARGWPAWIMEGDHFVNRTHPKELVQLLEKAAQ